MPDAEHPDAAAEDMVAQLREALEKAEATGAENWNRYLRAVAELDNVRKRAARDLDAARRSGVEKLAGELLGIVDTLEMGLENAGTASAESLLAGKQATLRLLKPFPTTSPTPWSHRLKPLPSPSTRSRPWLCPTGLSNSAWPLSWFVRCKTWVSPSPPRCRKKPFPWPCKARALPTRPHVSST